MSLITHDGHSLSSGHYFSGVFDVNTEILWHYDDDEITQISDFQEGVYTIESHKQKDKNFLCQAFKSATNF